jgi:hypothetical protein
MAKRKQKVYKPLTDRQRKLINRLLLQARGYARQVRERKG